MKPSCTLFEDLRFQRQSVMNNTGAQCEPFSPAHSSPSPGFGPESLFDKHLTALFQHHNLSYGRMTAVDLSRHT